jgi:hypothetical protein
MTVQTVSPYGYLPSVPMAIIGATLFSIATLISLFQYFKYKSWFFYSMMFGALLESSGYIGRAYSSTHLTDTTSFLVGYLTIMSVS